MFKLVMGLILGSNGKIAFFDLFEVMLKSSLIWKHFGHIFTII